MEGIVITGVSTGIGYGLSKIFIKNGYKVFGSIRKQEDADRLSSEMGANFTPLLLDITDQEAVQNAAKKVQQSMDGQPLSGLFNNAGIAINGPLMHISIKALKQQFDVNVFSQIAVTQAFLPMLGATKEFEGTPGKVFVVGSISGKIGFPFVGPYCGSKFALEGLCDTLRRELMLYGIPVVLLEPGQIKTAIWEKAESDDAMKEFEETDYLLSATKFKDHFIREGKKGMELDDFCQRVYTIFRKAKPRPRYVIMKKKFQGYTITNWLPDRVLDNIVSKHLGLSRNKLNGK